jgi:hypothetical protein
MIVALVLRMKGSSDLADYFVTVNLFFYLSIESQGVRRVQKKVRASSAVLVIGAPSPSKWRFLKCKIAGVFVGPRTNVWMPRFDLVMPE